MGNEEENEGERNAIRSASMGEEEIGFVYLINNI